MAAAVRRAVLLLGLGAGLAAGSNDSALAKSSYDGLWSVSIVTDAGACDRAYRYPIRIVNGIARHADQDSSFAISGRVDARGAVRVRVSRGNQSADGVGRLSKTYGSGRWNSAECAGRWEAERRG